MVVGDSSPFGDWEVQNGRKMTWQGGGNWALEFKFDTKLPQFQYKYALVSSDWGFFEFGPKRTIRFDKCSLFETMIVNDFWRVMSNGLYDFDMLIIFQPLGENETCPAFNSSLFTKAIFARKPLLPAITKVASTDGETKCFDHS